MPESPQTFDVKIDNLEHRRLAAGYLRKPLEPVPVHEEEARYRKRRSAAA
ncbi:hypothetical protein [Pseudactinotalea sp.]